MRDPSASRPTEITVDDTTCKIFIQKTGKSTWRTYGTFRGKHIDVGGKSESDALSQWRHIAEYEASQ